MLSFRHIRLLAAAAVAALALQSAPAEAATKSHKKKSAPAKKQGKRTVNTHSVKQSAAKSYAKTPPKKINIAKIEPAKSLYHKHEAEQPASRSLSFFGSLSSGYRYDSRMMRAAEIASARCYGHSHGTCWRYVKNALVAADVVDSRPKTEFAREAGAELTGDYGFRKIAVSDPYKAPVGSVIVYGGGGAGHVELRTKSGFVSDFFTPRACSKPLIGIYVKP